MNEKVGAGCRAALFPFLIGVSFLVFSFAYYAAGLPSPSELQPLMEDAFETYGLTAVFLGAFLEAFFVRSFYFPGSLVIVLSVLATGGDAGDLAQVTLAVGAGAFLGIVCDYCLGRWGLHGLFARFGGTQGLNQARNWQDRWGSWAMIIFGFHPNFLSLVATHAGISKASFLRVVTLAFFSLIFWTPVAVFLINLIVSEIAATSGNQHWIIFGLLKFWAALAFVAGYRGAGKNI